MLAKTASSPEALPVRTSPHSMATWNSSIAFRVGLCFLVIAVGVWAASLLTPDALPHDQIERSTALDRSPMMTWVVLSGLTTACGIASIYSLSSLAAIERQLMAASAPNTSLRPIIGSDPAVRGYNRLLQASQSEPPATAARPTSHLDDCAVTHARAMRVLDTAWIITDESAVIRYLSPKAKGLLNLPTVSESDGTADPKDMALNERAVSLIDALGISDNDLIDRFMSRIRLVRSSVQVDFHDQETHLDVTRSRLRGRDGDCEGMVWLIEDHTAQTQAIRSRDEFLMAATHELRTPLTNLRAHAEAIASEDGVEVELQKKFCNVLVSESIRMGRLVDNLLSMGQIEAGSLVIENREVDLHQVFSEVQDQVHGQAEEKQQTIRMDIADKLPTVMGDIDQLRSAVINLVGNAVKYTPNRGTVIIRCHHSELNDDTAESLSQSVIRIEVIDDGAGISNEDQARVFEKFYRCGNSQASERGNGLGLPLAREVARLHGGDISLESQPGKGCHFTMELPAAGQARSGLGHS